MEQGSREELLERLAELVGSVRTPHPTRVAVDGRPAAGKTTLANELGAVLQAQGRQVIRAGIDQFLAPRAQRYRRGKYSPEGCFHDSFDFEALYRVLLDPLGPGGERRFQTASYDRATDAAPLLPLETASDEAVLLFDGVFLLRPELINRWDLRIFVAADFEVTLARGRARKQSLDVYGSDTEVERMFRERYGPSQDLYFATAFPTDHANVVVHNETPQQPRWELRRQ